MRLTPPIADRTSAINMLLSLCKSLRFGTLVLLLSLPLGSAAQDPDPSLFYRTVIALQTAPEEWKTGFASIALSKLIDAYWQEAELARTDSSDNPKLARWARGVARYANDLSAISNSIEQGETVTLEYLAGQQAAITVDGASVMLTHPRPDQQTYYEQQVLDEFCSIGPCDELTATKPADFDSDRSPAAPEWQFSSDGPVCAYRGIAVSFQQGVKLASVRPLCQQLVTELAAVVRQLDWQHRHHVSINWQALSLTSVSQRTQHLLQVNEAGDSALLQAPVLASRPDLLRALTPWLKAQLNGQSLPVALPASHYQLTGQ